MIVYLAGPITAIGKAAAMRREAALAQALAEEGITTFAPAHAWHVLPPHAQYEDLGRSVQLVDDIAIAVSDVVLVTYMGHESEGTDHETKLALSLGKPIIVYAPAFLPPGWLGGLQQEWLRRVGLPLDVPWFTTSSHAVQCLVEWRNQ